MIVFGSFTKQLVIQKKIDLFRGKQPKEQIFPIVLEEPLKISPEDPPGLTLEVIAGNSSITFGRILQ